jgi:DNA-binding NtrC family response regulator
MSGAELIGIVKREYPDIVSVMHSGYAPTDELTKAVRRENIFRFVCKTLTLEEDLKLVVRQAVDHYNLQSQREKMLAESG